MAPAFALSPAKRHAAELAASEASRSHDKCCRTEEPVGLRYHHCQIYVDALAPLRDYKELEDAMTSWSNRHPDLTSDAKIRAAAEDWKQTGADAAAGRAGAGGAGSDLVRDLIVSFGWRIVAENVGSTTRSLVLRQRDPQGTQFIMTARHSGGSDPELDHFAVSHLDRFIDCHNGRQGVAVMAFQVGAGDAQRILDTYKRTHPKLVVHDGIRSFEDNGQTYRIFEAFSYYKGKVGSSDADVGTMLRFIEMSGEDPCYLGARPVSAVFDDVAQPSYFDHIVSNVVDRLGMIETLKDTLGFTPKVDFNAGVVAAGEAQIESTVIGNDSNVRSDDSRVVLEDQSQVYIPINNALSPFGHVHLFIEELGQGVQHIAHRVPDLVSFIARVNGIHKATGAGLTFKGLPRSYFGSLTLEQLTAAGVSAPYAEAIFDALVAAGLMSKTGILHDLDISPTDISRQLGSLLSGEARAMFEEHRQAVAGAISRSRYHNIYMLLRDQMDYRTYLTIVRNGILVDIQDGDILIQIFSKDILQRDPEHEAPFIETIQRICAVGTNPDGSKNKIKPGCGGFGIRNFLALFLSIEMNKAMSIQADGEATGDLRKASLGKKMVAAYTDQLNESNPILTGIAEAMTAEGKARDGLARATAANERAKCTADIARWEAYKEKQNQLLMECSQKYNSMLKQIRQEGEADAKVTYDRTRCHQ